MRAGPNFTREEALEPIGLLPSHNIQVESDWAPSRQLEVILGRDWTARKAGKFAAREKYLKSEPTPRKDLNAGRIMVELSLLYCKGRAGFDMAIEGAAPLSAAVCAQIFNGHVKM